ncbi:carboxypeptidase-like regulatory domain-containing protein [Ohtaekwangia kribbensis]|uniref:Carboxypeptidase-like regulatory domain-containing protein n=1 Tax=Ohtaekwangia kribbensis TaxID=688913 RepID=A0ABW3K6H3_9BACT
MRNIFTLLLFILAGSVWSQTRERVISGTLKDNEGYPLPGVNIVIKGTRVGTVTNSNGYYSLSAPIGSTLVFSFIGMQTREVLVTDKGQKAIDSSKRNTRSVNATSWPVAFLQDTIRDQRGVATLSNTTPVYIYRSDVIDPESIIAIRPVGRIEMLFKPGAKTYRVATNTDPVRTGFGLQFSSLASIERITQTPALQNIYAQGSNGEGVIHWHGADKREIYSWGPLLRTLEFDGSDYAFDKQGQLVQAGTGNGNPAMVYNPETFFRTGYSTEYTLMLTRPGPGNSNLIFDVDRKTRSGVIPGNDYSRSNFSFQVKKMKLGERVVADAAARYNDSESILANRGGNLTSITAAVWRTPASFNNNNGLTDSQARSHPEAYRFPDGSIRSYAPGVVDNPYGLAQELPDHENAKRLLASTLLTYNTSDRFSITINESFDRQWSNVVFGIPPDYAGYSDGRLTVRKEDQLYLNSIITPSYTVYRNGRQISIHGSYQFNHQQHGLERADGFGFSDETWSRVEAADSSYFRRRTFDRNTHEVLLNFQFNNRWLNVRAANRTYFSSTLSSDSYTNIFPTLSTSIDLSELLYIYPFDNFKVYASIARNLREAPLIYSGWSHLSTRMEASEYSRYSESAEIYFNAGLLPETERKFETGINVFSFNRLSLDAAYYNNVTEDFIAPLWNSHQFIMINVGRVKNYGTTLSANYNNYNRAVNWGVSVRWNKNYSKALQVYTDDTYIPLAGFQSTAAVLATGEVAGAIYGTTYLRNNSGQQIIGDDGFPLVDPVLKKIGNPLPDWTMSFDGFVRWKRFRASVLIDIKRGGDVWNGTQAALDYLGRSVATAQQRNTSKYIFEGISAKGQPNTILVNFYDAEKPLTDNRWVRYGFTGVGEQYIEDASWIRFAEASVSYTVPLSFSKMRELRISLVGKNLFLITPYSGVDPSTTLFGYSHAAGLDLFNAPATRSYSAQITIKI